jgi:hypothetical protein
MNSNKTKKHKFIPAPKQYALKPGSCTLGRSTVIFAESSLSNEKKHLSCLLGNYHGGKNSKISLSIDRSLSKEEYSVISRADQVEIKGGSSAGVFYGVQTLRSLLCTDGPVLKNFILKDSPDLEWRGLHLDFRVQIPTFSYLLETIDMCAMFKFNTLVVEYEGSFPFKNHKDIAFPSHFARQEIRKAVKYASERYIEIIPLQQTFGHLEYILSLPRYNHLNEHNWIEKNLIDQASAVQICPDNPKSIDFLRELISDMASMHPSKYFHIGADETYLLGHCDKCKKKAEKIGEAGVYLNHVNRVIEEVIKVGKKPIIWGDIFIKKDIDLKKLHPDVLIFDWHYEKDLKHGISTFKKHGFEVAGCPAAISYPDSDIHCDWQEHFVNTEKFCREAEKRKIKGIIQTAWTTSGGYQYRYHFSQIIQRNAANPRINREQAWYTILAAVDFAWNSGKSSVEKYKNLFAPIFYGVNDKEFNKAMVLLSKGYYDMKPCPEIDTKEYPRKNLSHKAIIEQRERALRLLKSLKPKRNIRSFKLLKFMAEYGIWYAKSKWSLEDTKQRNKSPFNFRNLQKQAGMLIKKLKPLLLEIMGEDEVEKDIDTKFSLIKLFPGSFNCLKKITEMQ